MEKQIEKVAEEYQVLDREAKKIAAKMKPLKAKLLDFAEKNTSEFDDAFQLKFENGTYISLRVSDALIGPSDAKDELASSTDLVKVQLDEKLVIEKAKEDDRLRKLLTKLGLQIGQKETYAVYAG
jgi:hypothetical protein